jgi:FHS family L-fucose permease-like MFS transporter
MQSTPPKKGALTSLLLVALLFSIFGFVTWLNGTLIKFLKTACELNHREASLVTFAFFISYFVMALPSSALLRRTGFKRGMSLGLLVMAAGCLIFLPAAWQRSYPLFLAGLFTQGLGLAILQTASNPYVTIIGPIESAARRISLMGICNKLAGALGAVVLAQVLLNPLDNLNEHLISVTEASEKATLLNALTARIITPYSILTLFLALTAVAIRFSPLPDVREEDEAPDTGADAGRALGSYSYLWLGALAIFAYVGVEVLAGDYIIQYGTYLAEQTGDETLKQAANYLTSLTLTLMLAGYGVGVVLTPAIISQEQMLRINVVGSLILATGVLVTTGKISVGCLALLGFFHAIMWPAIWPMSIKGLGRHTKTGSALLVMGIAGGAVIPSLHGILADSYDGNLQKAFWILVPCYLYLLFFAVRGHRIGYRES